MSWIGGVRSAEAAPGLSRGQGGQWSEVGQWDFVPLHAALASDGKLLTYGLDGDDRRLFDTWDPAGGISGGQITQLGAGEQMLRPRWYPSATTLWDGRILVQGGTDDQQPDQGGQAELTPEIYTPGQGWKLLHGATSYEVYGADADSYNYPRSWITPAGRIFGVTGPNMYWINPEGDGSIEIIGRFPATTFGSVRGASSAAVMYDEGKVLQVGGDGGRGAVVIDLTSDEPRITATAPMAHARVSADATVLPDGRVLVSGGAAAWLDLSDVAHRPEIWDPGTGQWTEMNPSALPRLYHSAAVLLGDGSVWTGGGGQPGPPDPDDLNGDGNTEALNNLNAEVFYPPCGSVGFSAPSSELRRVVRNHLLPTRRNRMNLQRKLAVVLAAVTMLITTLSAVVVSPLGAQPSPQVVDCRTRSAHHDIEIVKSNFAQDCGVTYDPQKGHWCDWATDGWTCSGWFNLNPPPRVMVVEDFTRDESTLEWGAVPGAWGYDIYIDGHYRQSSHGDWTFHAIWAPSAHPGATYRAYVDGRMKPLSDQQTHLIVPVEPGIHQFRITAHLGHFVEWTVMEGHSRL